MDAFFEERQIQVSACGFNQNRFFRHEAVVELQIPNVPRDRQFCVFAGRFFDFHDEFRFLEFDV